MYFQLTLTIVHSIFSKNACYYSQNYSRIIISTLTKDTHIMQKFFIGNIGRKFRKKKEYATILPMMSHQYKWPSSFNVTSSAKLKRLAPRDYLQRQCNVEVPWTGQCAAVALQTLPFRLIIAKAWACKMMSQIHIHVATYPSLKVLLFKVTVHLISVTIIRSLHVLCIPICKAGDSTTIRSRCSHNRKSHKGFA